MKKALVGVLVALVLGAAAMSAYLADIRPSSLRVSELPDEALFEGRARLSLMAAAHGAATWKNYKVMELIFTDEWFGMFGMLSIWPAPKQWLRGRFEVGSWTSQVAMLDGPKKGTTWGIQSWKTWTQAPGGTPVFAPDDNLEFSLPTVQYFFELPFRIQSATIVANAGDATWEDKSYHRVYATWETAEPHREVDQYLLWIDPGTSLLARVDFTVRDQAGATVASAAYRNYKSIGGVFLAHTIAINAITPGGFEPDIHRFTIDYAAWDTVPPDSLKPDPSLPAEGESKPTL